MKRTSPIENAAKRGELIAETSKTEIVRNPTAKRKFIKAVVEHAESPAATPAFRKGVKRVLRDAAE